MQDSVASSEKLVVRDDLKIKIYRRLAKKRHLRGKHTYEYERIYVPIPSRLHDIVRPFLNQDLKIDIDNENEGLTITARAYFLWGQRQGSTLQTGLGDLDKLSCPLLQQTDLSPQRVLQQSTTHIYRS